MAKVTGIGGFFFKTDDPTKTAAWMTDVLGLPTKSFGHVFRWRDREDPEKKGSTVMGLHKTTSDYYSPSTLPFMLNFRVDDLDGMLKMLEERGVKVIKRMDPEPNG